MRAVLATGPVINTRPFGVYSISNRPPSICTLTRRPDGHFTCSNVSAQIELGFLRRCKTAQLAASFIICLSNGARRPARTYPSVR